VQVNQVPGGMISNLSHQLKEQGSLNRMNEVLAEIPRVREDLGYPPLVTPTSQIIGTQAVFNVLTGQRYKSITNEVKMYLQGRYGRAPGAINETVRQMAIGDDEVISVRPADRLKPEMERLAQDIGGLARSTEDVLTYAMFPDVGRAFLEARASGTLSVEALHPVPGTASATASTAPTDFNVTVHGETYHLKITGAGHRSEERRPFYVTVDGVPEEILVETLGELMPAGAVAGGMRAAGKVSRRPKASQEGHVTSSMPGTIVDVMVKVGDRIKAGDAVLVIEAMKMENEVPATVTGSITAVNVAKGDNVNPDEALIEIA